MFASNIDEIMGHQKKYEKIVFRPINSLFSCNFVLRHFRRVVCQFSFFLRGATCGFVDILSLFLFFFVCFSYITCGYSSCLLHGLYQERKRGVKRAWKLKHILNCHKKWNLKSFFTCLKGGSVVEHRWRGRLVLDLLVQVLLDVREVAGLGVDDGVGAERLKRT